MFDKIPDDQFLLTLLMRGYLEASADGKPLKLKIDRNCSEKTIQIPPDPHAAHSRTCPEMCPRCERIIDESLERLALENPSSALQAAAMGFAFLAQGSTPSEGKYAEPLRRCVQRAADGIDKEIAISAKYDDPKVE